MTQIEEMETALAERPATQQRQITIKQLVDSPDIQRKLAQVASKFVTPEKLARAMLLAVNRNGDLARCSANSLLDCLMVAAQYGWTIGGPRPGMYLVPFKGVATAIPSYYGLMETARRSCGVMIDAHVVREGDDFTYCYGSHPKLSHTPHDEDTDITHAYAVARHTNGEVQFRVMTRADIDKIRKRSRASGSGPWVTDYPEMCCKTVVRRLCKYLPANPDLDGAIELSDRQDVEVSGEVVPSAENGTGKRSLAELPEPDAELPKTETPAEPVTANDGSTPEMRTEAFFDGKTDEDVKKYIDSMQTIRADAYGRAKTLMGVSEVAKATPEKLRSLAWQIKLAIESEPKA